MNFIFYVIIIVSGLGNMVADVLLQSGRDYSKGKQSEIEIIRATKEKHLLISAILGALCIMCWQAPLFLLIKIPATLGTILQFSFLTMISCIAIFHVVCCMAFHLCKANEEKEKIATKYLSIFGPLTFIPGLIFTAMMIYAGINGQVQLNWFHYLCLPIPAIILIQFIIGKLLKKIPYFSAVSGTLSMVVSIISVISVLM